MEESLPPSDDCWDFLYHQVRGENKRRRSQTCLRLCADFYYLLTMLLTITSEMVLPPPLLQHFWQVYLSSPSHSWLSAWWTVSPHRPLMEGLGYDRDLWQGLGFSSPTLEWQGPPPPAAGIEHKLSVPFLGWQRRPHL